MPSALHCLETWVWNEIVQESNFLWAKKRWRMQGEKSLWFHSVSTKMVVSFRCVPHIMAHRIKQGNSKVLGSWSWMINQLMRNAYVLLASHFSNLTFTISFSSTERGRFELQTFFNTMKRINTRPISGWFTFLWWKLTSTTRSVLKSLGCDLKLKIFMLLTCIWYNHHLDRQIMIVFNTYIYMNYIYLSNYDCIKYMHISNP